MIDALDKWACTGKNMMLAEIMQAGDDLTAEVKKLRQQNAELTKQRDALASAAADRWIDPNDKTQSMYLPQIGEKVLFCGGGKIYYGHHTGGSFTTGHGVTQKWFNTWKCHWMPLQALPDITANKTGGAA